MGFLELNSRHYNKKWTCSTFSCTPQSCWKRAKRQEFISIYSQEVFTLKVWKDASGNKCSEQTQGRLSIAYCLRFFCGYSVFNYLTFLTFFFFFLINDRRESFRQREIRQLFNSLWRENPLEIIVQTVFQGKSVQSRSASLNWGSGGGFIHCWLWTERFFTAALDRRRFPITRFQTIKFDLSATDEVKEFYYYWKNFTSSAFIFEHPPTLGQKYPKKPTKECLGVGPIVQTTVSPYSPADQQALGGDWLGGAGATKDPFCSFRG